VVSGGHPNSAPECVNQLENLGGDRLIKNDKSPVSWQSILFVVLTCISLVRNAIKRVFYGLAGERSRLMNWPDLSPARSLSLVVG